MGAIAPSLALRFAPCVLMDIGARHRRCPGLWTSFVNYYAPSGILAWLPAWLNRGAQAIDILLIFSSLDGTSSVRLKLCCTATPGLLIFSSLDGSSSVRLKLCCTAAPRLLIFSSLDGSSSVRLKLCCTAAPRLLIVSSLDGSTSARPKLFCTQARSQVGAMGALHHQLHYHPFVPFGASLCTLCT